MYISEVQDTGGRDAASPTVACRICTSPRLESVLDLGRQPLANAFRRAEDLDSEEATYPLDMCRCPACGHIQLSFTVPATILFRDYAYVSGTSETFVAHFRAYARELAARYLPKPSFVVEIGSNDGTLLAAFDRSTTRVLGVEPATNIAAMARRAGVETREALFTSEVAREIASSHGHADAILANNVLAHIDDLADVTAAIAALLTPDGVFVAEFPYLGDLLDRVAYDTIYHEHLSYFSLRAASDLFDRAGLVLFDVERVPIHGGSLRIFVGRDREVGPSVRSLMSDEQDRGINSRDTYATFADAVRTHRAAFVALLKDMKADGKRLAGYGAAAKGNTLLNYCRIGHETLEFIADNSPLKQGLFTPGGRIPIRPPNALLEERPDVTVLLAWNLEQEIMRQQADYRAQGGRFVVPVPVPRIL